MYGKGKLGVFLINILLVLALLGGSSFAFFEEDRISVKMAGMGNLYAEDDIAGAIFYPTTLPSADLGFEFMHSQGYTPSSGQDFGGVIKGFGKMGVGVGFNRVQERDLRFSESATWFTVGMAFSPSLSFGLGSKLLKISSLAKEDFRTYSIEPSVQFTKEPYCLRIKANNFLVGKSDLEESIVKYLESIVIYRGDSYNLIFGYNELAELRIGFEQFLNNDFQLRAGYESEGTISVGTTISMGRLNLNYALINNPITGIQQRFSISY